MATSSQYSISDLAKEFGITTRTIRHYEEIGLLKPKRDGQNRLYNSADRTKLKLILRGKRLGFSLDESRAIIEMYTPGDSNIAQLQTLINRIEQQKQKATEQLNDIQQLLAELEQAAENCRLAMADAEH